MSDTPTDLRSLRRLQVARGTTVTDAIRLVAGFYGLAVIARDAQRGGVRPVCVLEADVADLPINLWPNDQAQETTS